VDPVRARSIDAYFRNPYGHRNRERLFLPLGNSTNKIPSPVQPDTYNVDSRMVFPAW
jgi:hypothetical protein